MREAFKTGRLLQGHGYHNPSRSLGEVGELSVSLHDLVKLCRGVWYNEHMEPITRLEKEV